MSAVTQAGPRAWIVQGRALSLPVEIRDARLALSVCRAPAADARDALVGTPFRPLTVGRSAFSVVVFVRYLDGDLDRYDELGIGTVVRGIHGPPGVYVHHLPVTEEFTMYAGRWIWGLPKYIVQTGCTVEGRQIRIDMRTDEHVIVAGSMTTAVRVPGRITVPTTGWSVGIEGKTEGAVLRTPGRMTMSDIRIGRRGTELSWGEHVSSKQAVALRLHTRPLLTVTARVKLSIDAAVALTP